MVDRQRGDDPAMNEIWEALDTFAEGTIPPGVRDWIAGNWRGSIIRHCAAERERVLQWFEQRSPQLVEAYRDREMAHKGDDE